MKQDQVWQGEGEGQGAVRCEVGIRYVAVTQCALFGQDGVSNRAELGGMRRDWWWSEQSGSGWDTGGRSTLCGQDGRALCSRAFSFTSFTHPCGRSQKSLALLVLHADPSLFNQSHSVDCLFHGSPAPARFATSVARGLSVGGFLIRRGVSHLPWSPLRPSPGPCLSRRVPVPLAGSLSLSPGPHPSRRVPLAQSPSLSPGPRPSRQVPVPLTGSPSLSLGPRPSRRVPVPLTGSPSLSPGPRPSRPDPGHTRRRLINCGAHRAVISYDRRISVSVDEVIITAVVTTDITNIQHGLLCRGTPGSVCRPDGQFVHSPVNCPTQTRTLGEITLQCFQGRSHWLCC